ncbi:hypothetical protein CDAR_268781 [Caerostris darwini]|uniref:Uncharacterized protein n=1 Tax=Caerostris darwini TaxID=1538125 RepID=A0AAV4R0S7_9ARAC|nr:hypothetical protein CDAR_268781 [Caerostris darwini]
MGTIPDAIDHGPVLSVLIHHLLSEKTSLPLLFPIFLVGGAPFSAAPLPSRRINGINIRSDQLFFSDEGRLHFSEKPLNRFKDFALTIRECVGSGEAGGLKNQKMCKEGGSC